MNKFGENCTVGKKNQSRDRAFLLKIKRNYDFYRYFVRWTQHECIIITLLHFVNEFKFIFVLVCIKKKMTTELGIGPANRKLLNPNFENDTVYLYQFPRAACIPSPSPFVLKLETYLRIAKIKYQVTKSF